jgi:alpha-beta hydrolase superfamily lysophospholipase
MLRPELRQVLLSKGNDRSTHGRSIRAADGPKGNPRFEHYDAALQTSSETDKKQRPKWLLPASREKS